MPGSGHLFLFMPSGDDIDDRDPKSTTDPDTNVQHFLFHPTQ